MVVDKNANRFVEKRDLIHLAILLAAVLVIGIYLIATTVLIAKDGVLYIEYAKKLAVEPVKTMRGIFIHPGYSFLICITHKLVSLFYRETSLESWIISAQSVSLLCKIIATVTLYLVGSLLIGRQMSFWAVLILTILPVPAKYGSDALSDWPHLLFLAMGFWLLLLGAIASKWWMFGCAGVIAGLGYLIRPECCQLTIYGGGWLLFNLIRPQNKMSRARAVAALIFLLAGFGAITVPYMRFMGYIFPEHYIGSFRLFVGVGGSNIDAVNVANEYYAAFVPGDMAKGLWKLANEVCETLIYFFVPAWLIGMYYHFRQKAKETVPKFFVTAFVFLNIVVLLLHYCRVGVTSRRYVLPLVAFTIFYVPFGLKAVGNWLQKKSSKNISGVRTIRGKPEFWFLVLLLIGIGICLPKLIRPIRIEKQGYRTAAKWLKKNTAQEDLIVVPDHRIGFYAERPAIEILGDKIPEKAKYIVKIMKSRDKRPTSYRNLCEVYVDERNKKGKLIIYKIM